MLLFHKQVLPSGELLLWIFRLTTADTKSFARLRHEVHFRLKAATKVWAPSDTHVCVQQFQIDLKYGVIIYSVNNSTSFLLVLIAELDLLICLSDAFYGYLLPVDIYWWSTSDTAFKHAFRLDRVFVSRSVVR